MNGCHFQQVYRFKHHRPAHCWERVISDAAALQMLPLNAITGHAAMQLLAVSLYLTSAVKRSVAITVFAVEFGVVCLWTIRHHLVAPPLTLIFMVVVMRLNR